MYKRKQIIQYLFELYKTNAVYLTVHALEKFNIPWSPFSRCHQLVYGCCTYLTLYLAGHFFQYITLTFTEPIFETWQHNNNKMPKAFKICPEVGVKSSIK